MATLVVPARRSDRTVAIAAGALYVVATASGVLASVALGSSLRGPDVLAGLAGQERQVFAAAFFQLVMAIAVAGIAFMLYPVLRRDADTLGKQGLALWYVGTRITEGAVFLVGILATLALLALSKGIAGAGASAFTHYQPVADALTSLADYAWILGQTVFCVGVVFLYSLLFVSRRVPLWLSVWGLVAAPLMLVAGLLLPVTGEPDSTVSSVLYAPMGVQEMVLALWLMIKGFALPEQGRKEG